MGDVKGKALVDTLCDTLAEVVGKTIADTVTGVEDEAFVKTVGDSCRNRRLHSCGDVEQN